MADLNRALPPSINSNNSENSSLNPFPVDLKGVESFNKNDQLMLPPKPSNLKD